MIFWDTDKSGYESIDQSYRVLTGFSLSNVVSLDLVNQAVILPEVSSYFSSSREKNPSVSPTIESSILLGFPVSPSLTSILNIFDPCVK